MAPRLAGHQCIMIISSQSDLNLISPCGFPVCHSVRSVSKPVSSTLSFNLPSVASGRGVSLGLLSWICQAVMSLVSGSTSVSDAWPAPWGQRCARGPARSGQLLPIHTLPAQDPSFTSPSPSNPEQQLGKKGAKSSQRWGRHGSRVRGVTYG